MKIGDRADLGDTAGELTFELKRMIIPAEAGDQLVGLYIAQMED